MFSPKGWEAGIPSSGALMEQRIEAMVRAGDIGGIQRLLNPAKWQTARSLVIAPGSFGCRVLRQTRKRAHDSLRDENALAIVGLYGLDSDHQPTDDFLETGDLALDAMESDPAEFGDLAITRGSLREFTDVGNALSWHYWLPDEVLRIGLRRSGFAASPPAGRSGAIYNREDIKRGLKHLIDRVCGVNETNRARASQIPIANAHADILDVYLFAGLMGGTASGAFPEIARALHEVKRERALPMHITGIIALPGAVNAQDGGRKARANALAILKELQASMTGELVRVCKHSLDDLPAVEQEGILFDSVMLVDNAVNGA